MNNGLIDALYFIKVTEVLYITLIGNSLLLFSGLYKQGKI